MPNEKGETTTQDWYRAGEKDGLQGSPAYPPKGDVATREAYWNGYRSARREIIERQS